MTIRGGHRGQLTFTKDGSDTATELHDGFIFSWRMDLTRAMIDLTEVDSSTKDWMPGHATGVVTLKAYIDATTGPGGMNGILADVVLYPGGNDAGGATKNIAFEGWIEKYSWTLSMDRPPILDATIRISGDATLTWT